MFGATLDLAAELAIARSAFLGSRLPWQELATAGWWGIRHKGRARSTAWQRSSDTILLPCQKPPAARYIGLRFIRLGRQKDRRGKKFWTMIINPLPGRLIGVESTTDFDIKLNLMILESHDRPAV